jgi:hypothetical protein
MERSEIRERGWRRNASPDALLAGRTIEHLLEPPFGLVR